MMTEERDVKRTALGMALAGHRNDLAAVYETWNTLDLAERTNAIAVLVQLPAITLRGVGQDPERILTGLLARLAQDDDDGPEISPEETP